MEWLAGVLLLECRSLAKRFFEERNKILGMFALGEVGKDAAVLRMQRSLRKKGIAEDLIRKVTSKIAVRLQKAHCGLVTACFDRKDFHHGEL